MPRLLRHTFGMTLMVLLSLAYKADAQKVWFTNGFKVMDVTASEVTVWTRLCAAQYPNPIVHDRQDKVFRHPVNFDEEMPVALMDGAVQGSEGFVRITLASEKKVFSSGWLKADAAGDFTAFHHFSGLSADTRYRLVLEARKLQNGPLTVTEGVFRTLPAANKTGDLRITTSTCQYFWSHDDSIRGFKTYLSMGNLHPDLFVQTGDYVYYDKPGPMAVDPEKARHKWHAMDGWPSLREFYAGTPVYLLKDDHDLLADDVHPGSKPFGRLTVEDGLRIWRENVPLRGKPYRTVALGSDLQLWFMEGREYRSANDMPDGPEKSIWGAEQKQWLMETMNASKAAFKILFSPTPLVGPDRPTKKDNHANTVFRNEGDWARKYLAERNAIVVNGDRHWQYVSRDSATGLWEFGSGPVSDYHAQGWPPGERKPEHRFLRVAGGFLAIDLKYEKGRPTLTFTHYDVDGNRTHQETLLPEDHKKQGK